MTQLRDGCRVVIAGGGPAGSSAAILLKDHAQERGIDLDVKILEKSNFAKGGPGGCKGCAGIVSASLIERLRERGIAVPDNVIQKKVDGYVFETPNESLFLEDERGQSVTVFRGNGPGRAPYEDSVSFDGFLKEEAERRGVEFVNTRVKSIKSARTIDDRVFVTTERSKSGPGHVYTADLLVGAVGMRGAHLFEKADFGYKLGDTVKLGQSEIALDPEQIKENFGGLVHIYSLGIPGVKYAALTPKEDFVTVTVISNESGKTETPKSLKDKLDAFLNQPKVAPKLEDGMQIGCKSCFCAPEVPISGATQPYGDRIVMIGDAGYTRLYKNGIESAFITADLAMQAALEYGVSKEAFEKHYHSEANRRFNRDNKFGEFLFGINDVLSKATAVTDAHVRVANKDTRNGERLRKMFFSLFTGDRPYASVAADIATSPLLQAELGLATLRGIANHAVTALQRVRGYA
ncbi:MAG: NAD(P)/FAD-dependent oxidoreductase [Candidatus Nanoarchaeia archaeon]